MRIVADESCDFGVVRALRKAGHDVLAVAESAPQTEDPEVLSAAQRDGRVLITEDKDFGHLVRALGARSSGVILLRFPATARAAMATAVVALCGRLGAALRESFVVLEPGRTRISRLRQE